MFGVIAVLADGREFVVDTYPKRDTAKREARKRQIATGTEHYASMA